MEGKDSQFEKVLQSMGKHVSDLEMIDTQHATGLNALTSKVSSLYQSDNQMTSKLVKFSDFQKFWQKTFNLITS